jgi:hypothetical protein
MSVVHIGRIRTALKQRFEHLIDLGDVSQNVSGEQRENAFLTRSLAAFAIAEHADTDDRIAAAAVVDGFKDNGIDGFYFDNKERICYLVQSKWSHNGKNSIEVGDIHKVIQGVRDLFNSRLERFNKLQKHREEIDNALSDTSARFILLIVYTGVPELANEVKIPLDDLLKEMNDVDEFLSYRVLRQVDLHSIVAKKAQGFSIDVDIMLYEWGKIDEPYRAFYGQVALEDIVKWDQYGNNLFVKNLRGFKGNTDVNDAIIHTMRQSPQNFWYFNNGITILCNKVTKQRMGGNSRTSGVFKCEGASVVNGAQTVGSIIAALKGGENGFPHARVHVRLSSLEGSPPNFDADLTRAANTQNRIERKDFAALDPTQKRLHSDLFLDYQKEYAYRTGDPVPQPDEGCTLDEAAIALACTQEDVALVVYAKAAPWRLYDDIKQSPYTKLFNPSLSALKLWRSIRILRAVDGSLKQNQSKLSAKPRYIAVHAYRFVLHLVFREVFTFESTTNEQFEGQLIQIPQIVEEKLSKVIVKAEHLFPGTYAGNLFKNISKCRDLVAALDGTNTNSPRAA